MSKIDIHTFGGLVPKLSARATPADKAQVAHNLYQNVPEFCPLPADTTAVAVSGVNNPKTIFRFKRNSDGSLNTDFATAAKWQISSIRKSWARGQVNNDLTDRHYVSFDDGSAAPRSIDATGSDRQLGVPQPATAPIVVVNTVAQYSTEDRTAAIAAMLDSLKNAANTAFLQPVWKGKNSSDPSTYRPGGTHAGYADRDYVPGVDPQEAQQLRMFRVTSTGGADNGTISNDYTGGSGQTWPFDGALGGIWVPSTSSWPGFITWPGSTYDHWALPFHAYGLTYDLASSSASTYLTAMEKPGGAPGEKLLTSGQVTAAVAAAQAVVDAEATAAGPKLDALYAKVQEAKVLMNSGTAASLVTSVSAYYASTAITTLFAAEIATFAEAAWNQAVQAHAYVDFAPPG